jgi:lipopolysaccharide transport system ATP-binding protein
MSCDPAISVVGLSKCYTMYNLPQDRLKQAIIPRLARAAAPLARAVGKDLIPPVFYQHHWALRDVSFEVGRGETLGVIGRNGAGKSTLLQLICGTLSPTSGSVSIKGRVGALLELGSGFNPDFTGRENVYLNATVLGLTGREIEAKLDDILAFADIGSFIDQPIKTYSSGMSMRLAFAVIAHIDADILIIDEALAVGDAFFQQKCMRWLRRFREHGTVLFCGHDTGAVINLCHDAVWLEGGEVRAYGAAKEVCEAYLASVRLETTGIAEAGPATAPSRAARRLSAPPRPASVASKADLGSLPQILSIADYEPDADSFGDDDARVIEVRFLRADGAEIGLLQGGEPVAVIVKVQAAAELFQPIIGFFVKDRLGQPLFGDNTHLTYRDRGIVVAPGALLQARFVFDLPLLRTGEYTITVAVATGTLEEHVVHHWVHDAVLLTVRSPLLTGVMVGVPMLEVTLTEECSPAEAELTQGANR